MTSDLASFWFDVYNTDDSVWPFVVPAAIWMTCWLYYWRAGKEFAKWYELHTFHHVGAILFGSLSLFFNDNSVFNERIGILWSMPYFMIDILDCGLKGHLTYIAHGAICLGLGLCNYNIPLLRELRMNSKASYIESSSILLYQCKKYRNPTLFFAFGILYTLCRIVWIPFMGNQLVEAGMPYHHPILLGLLVFYGLQVWWWIKIIKIAVVGAKDEEKTD